ncbi:MAG: dephospho-CoA kinase [Dehalococcoidia bacterium]
MRVIGLTGGIGSGKSTVSGFLAELGAVILDADKVGHELLHPDTETARRVIATFGQDIVKPNGEVDRSRLGEKVFNNPEALKQLNAIVHPALVQRLRERLAELREGGGKVVVVEAAIMIEAGWQSLADEIWVTLAPEDTVVERLTANKGLSEAQVRARIRSQMPVEEKAKWATEVIDTTGSLEEVRSRVEELWRRLNPDS